MINFPSLVVSVVKLERLPTFVSWSIDNGEMMAVAYEAIASALQTMSAVVAASEIALVRMTNLHAKLRIGTRPKPFLGEHSGASALLWSKWNACLHRAGHVALPVRASWPMPT